MAKPIITWLRDLDTPREALGNLAVRLGVLAGSGLPALAGFAITESPARLLKKGKLLAKAESAFGKAYSQFYSGDVAILTVTDKVLAMSVARQKADYLAALESHLNSAKGDIITLNWPAKCLWSGSVKTRGQAAQITAYQGYPALMGPEPKAARAEVSLLELVPEKVESGRQRFRLSLESGRGQLVHHPAASAELPPALLGQVAVLARQLEAVGFSQDEAIWTSDGERLWLVLNLPEASRAVTLPEARVLVPGFAVGPVRRLRTKRDLALLKPHDIAVLDHPISGLADSLHSLGGLVLGTLSGADWLVEAARHLALPSLLLKRLPAMESGQLVTLDALSGRLVIGKAERPTILPPAEEPLDTEPQLGVDLTLADDAAWAGQIPVSAALFNSNLDELRAENLDRQLTRLATVFFPRPVMYRLSDPALAKKEIEAIQQLRADGLDNFEILLPNARGAAEIKVWLAKHQEADKLPLHIEIGIPALVYDLSELDDLPIAGLVVDLEALARFTFATGEPPTEAATSPAIMALLKEVAIAAGKLDCPWSLRARLDLLTPASLHELTKLHLFRLILPPVDTEDAAALLASRHHHK